MESLGCNSQQKIGKSQICSRAILLYFLFLLPSCIAPSPTSSTSSTKVRNNSSYTGLWVAPEDDKTSFELDLEQSGLLLEGYHAALDPNTANIEAALRTDRDPPSVRGQISEKGSAIVRFDLRRGVGGGEAVLTMNGDKLKWKIISSTGASVLPKSCVLFRQSAAEH